MPHARKLTNLGYALLGLVARMPATGYALRKIFATTPIGNYSSSPGSIYPALAKLSRSGLVEIRQPTADALLGQKAKKLLTGDFLHTDPVPGKDKAGRSRGAPGKGLYHITDKGARVLDDWLKAPVDGKDLSSAMLRFSFLDASALGPFLIAFETAATSEAQALKAFLDSDVGQSLPRQSQVAVTYGVSSLQSSAAWAAWARADLQTTAS